MNAGGEAGKAVTAGEERLKGSRESCKGPGDARVLGSNQVKMEKNTGVLIRFLLPEINILTKSNLGGEALLGHTFTSQSMMKGSQDRNTRQESAFYTTQNHPPRVAPPQ